MNDMKCPICGQELKNINLVWFCENESCRAYDWTMEESAWQELICTRKALEIAVRAIETIKYSKKSDAINLRHKANKALIEIYKIKDQTALEQKE